ncbi:MAG: FAD-dependent oxidoreductase [Azospirillaceae bacterium]|nr:FAD-dependent oxidoreductase [Azospirillaceae bacterium]
MNSTGTITGPERSDGDPPPFPALEGELGLTMDTDHLRRSHPGLHPAAETVDFTYDGQRFTGIAGETIAAALAAHGIIEFRHTRNGGRRGLYCGMGACFDCLVTVDGKASQRACLTKIAAGQQIRSRMPDGTATDPLSPLTSPPDGAAPGEQGIDILVIGAGPGGLSAAVAAAECGASVVVLDERPQSGGQFYKPLAPSHRATKPLDRQFRDGHALTTRARRAGVTIVQDATVWGAITPNEVVAVVEGREVVYRPRRLIIAPGAYERPTPFPGWTLPGVMTTGAAQTLIRSYRVAPGQNVVIAGNGPLNLQLAVELVASGVNVVAVIESAPRPSPRQWRDLLTTLVRGPGLIAQGALYLAKLWRAGVPVLWSRAILSAEGDGRLQRLRHAPLDARGVLQAQDAVTVAADVLCLGSGFLPSTEIARALGCNHIPVDRHIGYLATETGPDGLTTVPDVFVVGDGADLGGAQVALARGTLAGIAAATQLGHPAAADARQQQVRRQLRHASAFQAALWSIYRAPPPRLDHIADDTVLCRCEDITFGAVRHALAAGHDSIAALKRNLRLGMGRCQGRYCVAVAARLLWEQTGRATTADALMAPRLPAKPVPAGALAFEKPEWGGHQRAITPDLARPVETGPLPDAETAILVIGGGIVGSCLAYYLSQAGADVLVVERDDVNLQASGANAGSLHVQLLSFDFGAKAEAGGGPAAATLPLGPRSIALWQALQRDCGADFEIRVTGGLMVADSDAGMAFLRAKAALERRHGIENAIIDAAELQRLAPALSGALIGAEYAPQEGKINPLRATYAVLEQARRQGARFIRGANVTAIQRDGAGWAVTTNRCRIRAGRIINAAGPWSREIGRLVNIDVPVHSAPLQMIATEPAPPLVSHLVAHADRHLSLKQTASGSLLIGGAWTAAFDPRRRFNAVTRPSIEGNLWVARHVLPQMAGLHVIRAWAAMNVNIDGAPVLGPVPGLAGFFNCVTSNGYTLAPVVARITADLLLHGRTDIDIAPYRIDRFG